MTRRQEENIVGKRFEMLTVLRELEPYINGGKPRRKWECKCDCGNITHSRSWELRNGGTKSCGCRKAPTMRANVTKAANDLAALQNRWRRLQEYGARMPNLKLALDDLEKEFPTVL